MFEISREMFCHCAMNVVKAMELLYVVKAIVLQMALTTLKNDLDNIQCHHLENIHCVTTKLFPLKHFNKTIDILRSSENRSVY